MLDANPVNITAIHDAIIYVHRNNAAPLAGLPAGVTLHAAGTLQIEYGYNNIRYGSIEITRGQFTVSRVTNAIGAWIVPGVYNHAGASQTKQSYIDALKNNNLSGNQTYFSALIILTSECCRSRMVSSAIDALMNDNGNFSNDVWMGLQFAFNNYGHTATFKGYDINAGGQPWTPLSAADYLGYINSPGYNGNVVDEVARVTAVRTYINAAG